MEDITKAITQAAGTEDTKPGPLDGKSWFQYYTRLARPTLRWVAVIGVLYGSVIGNIVGKPMLSEQMWPFFALCAAIYGLRSLERINGAC